MGSQPARRAAKPVGQSQRRRKVMKAMTILVTVLGLALGVGATAGQPTKLLRDQLVGTWSFVIAEITAADGKKSLPFGDKPKGMIIFTADGHFSQVHVAGGLPKIASNNRLAGTAEDNKAIVAGTLARRCAGLGRLAWPGY